MKTLKDFECSQYDNCESICENCSGPFIDKEELRQEAINWIKDLNEKLRAWKEYNPLDEIGNLHNEIIEQEKRINRLEAKIDLLVEFFNITEEELNA